jgi:hypothetical protein
MRVNIEREFFSEPRVKKLVRLTGANYVDIAGPLVHIWFQSQQAKKIYATGEEILEWSDLEDQPDFIDHMIASRFLIPQDDGLFEIIGNRKQLTKQLLKDVMHPFQSEVRDESQY